MLSNERAEFKNAIADSKEMGDNISTAVVESVIVGVHTSVGHCVEEACRDYVDDCVEDCGAEVAEAATCESSDIVEKGPWEEEHCSNTGETLYGIRMPMSFHLCSTIPIVLLSIGICCMMGRQLLDKVMKLCTVSKNI